MKAILMSIKPEWVAKILNGEKTIEIRKKFPKDYVGWVYIYCCAEDKNGYLIRNRSTKKMEYTYNGFVASVCWLANRKVVARFWCDKVGVHYKPTDTIHKNTISFNEIMEKGCLAKQELTNYRCKGGVKDIYAIHITKLEIFDKPKEISEFYKLGAWKVYEEQLDSSYMKRTEQEIMKSLGQVLTRAPQSWCYVEVE